MQDFASTTAKLPVLRLAVAGALTAAIIFALCWAGTFLPIGPATHAYLQLFTSAETTSVAALLQGLCWSLAFGLIAAGLFALLYNALSGFGRG